MDFSQLLSNLKRNFNTLNFTKSDTFYWSPREKTVYFAESTDDQDTAIWTLLHETAHGTLNHFDFKSDFHLISLEADAWKETLTLCGYYAVQPPDTDYVEDCIDTYRDWQYRRSLCPKCNSGGMQFKADAYMCILCRNVWEVTKERFCRAYRKNKTALL